MIYAAQNETFEAVADGAPAGLVGTITVEIYDPSDSAAVILAATSAGITEARPGTYVTQRAVASAGTFRVRWRYVDTTGPVTAEEDLTVGETATTVRPTVGQVALLLRTRTVGRSSGGLGGDTGPSDITTFTTTTRPSSTEVAGLIDVAAGVVLGPLGGASKVPSSRVGQVRHAIALYTAMMVETSFFREQSTTETRRQWMELYDQALTGVQDAVESTSGAPGLDQGFGTLGLRSDTRVASDAVVPGWSWLDG